ncbi:selenocysteine-specific translation elongation factor [Sporomusa sphaeroides]|uniref:Selenocysteine-specific elongation factor n=1 Tax=Sporomusa sphaeroides DSM 2875 TaxID=1337886 RepID=A0ABM9VZ30_9FIRM|nr:selenocysteine-specific translation elongation factor [Sporomusa sphaeroides]OLS57364.1 selenocysteine-specific elongation factor [Sporomusa sphaeroides DSM 2875]CVK18076.1 Selenocysteine-specific elongation factor [Sporomusa sphaeroides DSM 2875]
MDSIVIGTAGHIDHGKTSLVKALTGFDADTLAEEKRRGITINLGFAYCSLPCGRTAGFVDVPGHERFVKNMLAGASGIDIAMVVIAASEGIMPQTREHIHILQYLGIEQAIVVLTKISMVDDDFRELVVEDTKEYLATTALAHAPVVQVDSITGQGIPELLALLNDMAAGVRREAVSMPSRLPVDRVFSIKGFGTVVTGTLNEGSISLNDELAIYPEGLPVKVRGIQIHEQAVTTARAGQRTALNLSGVSVEEVHRGCVVAKPGSVQATSVLDVYLSVAADASQPLKRLEQLKLYLGAAEVVTKVVLMGCKEIYPGEECYAKLLTESPVIARKADRFVLRSLSPVQTIGGGRVVDPAAKRSGYTDEQALHIMQIKDQGAPQQVLEVFARENLFGDKEAIASAANIEAAEKYFEILLEEGRILLFENRVAHIEALKALLEKTLHILEPYHTQYPLRTGMAKAELQARLEMTSRPREFEWLLGWMKETEAIGQSGLMLYKAGFTPVFSKKLGAIRDEMLAAVRQAGYSPLTVNELAGSDKDRQAVLEALLQSDFLAVDGQVIILKELYVQAKETAVRLNRTEGAIRLADFRDSLGTSRKYALLLLEKMDRDKFTVRQGEERVLI